MENRKILWELPPPESEKELTTRIMMLEISARKNSFNFLHGNYVTRVRGKGMDFHEARKYVYGESIRQIDWNITARMSEPYVRVYNEEREREIFIVLDVSPSMHTGWQERRKIEYAVEIAASLAFSAVYFGDKLGFVTYSDEVLDYSFPLKGKTQFMRAIKIMYARAVNTPHRTAFSDMRQAVHRIQGFKGKRFMIFFISDFIEEDIPDDIRFLQARHDVTLFHIYDPVEYKLLEKVIVNSSSPEGSISRSRTAPGNICTLEDVTCKLKAAAGTHNIRFNSISTGEDIGKTLTQLFYFLKRG